MANTRREFLSKVSSAAALGGLSASSVAVWASPASSGDSPLGVAVVGLGSQSQQVLSADLATSPWCRIAGLVSSNPNKAQSYASRLGISRRQLYNYESFDRIAQDESIDIVYIAIPNTMHCEFALRAAAAGKHVFCESPMSVSSEQCRLMIQACKDNSRALAVASSPLVRPLGCLGKVQSIEAACGFEVDPRASWRLERQLAGGGALLQAGIDVLRTQRLWAESTPRWVIAQETKTDTARFAQVEESVTWSLGFENGAIAHGAVSLNYRGRGHLCVQGQIGSFKSEFPDANLHWTRANQLETFAASILGKPIFPDNRFNRLDAQESLEDIWLAESILQSIQEQREIQLG